MNKVSICIIAWMIITSSCKNKTANYENNLGIKPGVIAQLDTANYTKITWKDTVSNFGIIKEGDSVVVKFRFMNSGNKLLFLTDVQPSCGCTEVSYPQNAIQPGKGGELTAVFNSSDHPGFIHKTIGVTTNTVNRIHHLLLFSGQVKDSSQHNK